MNAIQLNLWENILVKVKDFSEELGLTQQGVNYRIKTIGAKKHYIHPGGNRGQELFISEEDADKIRNWEYSRHFSDWVKGSELAEEYSTTPAEIGRIATQYGIKPEKIRRDGRDDAMAMCYEPEKAKQMREILKVTDFQLTYYTASSSVNNSTLNANRKRSLYHRLTPYGGLMPWEK